MEVTPQLLNEQEFREARRGYDMREVDEFLERVAVGVARLQERLNQVTSELEGARGRMQQLEADVENARSSASSSSETDETLRRTLVLAQKTADAAVAEAEESAARTVEKAEQQAEFVVREANEAAERTRIQAETDARRVGEDTRRRVAEEVSTLEAAREALNVDVRALRRYLDDQRTRLRTTARDLQRLVDDPTALRDLEPPELTDVPEVPDAPEVPDEPEAVEAEAVEAVEPPPAAADETAASLDEPADEPAPADEAVPELTDDEPVIEAIAPLQNDQAAEEFDLFADDPADDDTDYFEDLRRAMSEPDETGLDGDPSPSPENL